MKKADLMKLIENLKDDEEVELPPALTGPEGKKGPKGPSEYPPPPPTKLDDPKPSDPTKDIKGQDTTKQVTLTFAELMQMIDKLKPTPALTPKDEDNAEIFI